MPGGRQAGAGERGSVSVWGAQGFGDTGDTGEDIINAVAAPTLLLLLLLLGVVVVSVVTSAKHLCVTSLLLFAK